ncbi:hypothetical protein SMC26_34395 [Actinomadura fulvescens]|uniref:DUF4239 domain-containing protein n=1 Tax=Actinomadura fulvescens TaxID=46160 RepID=A0ABN3QVJ9_9ACTN
MTVYFIAAASAVGLVIIAALLVRRVRSGTDDEAPDGPTTGHTGAMLSALFLLAFAIAIVVPWTTTDSARLNTYAESQAIVEGAWSATDLPPTYSNRVRSELYDYAQFVRTQEWRLMANGRLSPDGWTRLERLRRDVAAFPAKSTDQKDTQAAVLDDIADITSARRQRAMDAKTTPPPGLLAVTLLTGLIVLLFPILAGARPRGMSILPLALMAALLGIGMYLTFDISHTFTGALGVKPDAFTAILDELQRIPGSG